jgi:hypothetical protein
VFGETKAGGVSFSFSVAAARVAAVLTGVRMRGGAVSGDGGGAWGNSGDTVASKGTSGRGSGLDRKENIRKTEKLEQHTSQMI